MGPLPYPPLSHKIDLTLAQGRWREKNGDQENNPPLKGGGLLLPSNNLPFCHVFLRHSATMTCFCKTRKAINHWEEPAIRFRLIRLKQN